MTDRAVLALRLAALPAIAALLAYAAVQGAEAPTAAEGYERTLGILAAAGLGLAALAVPPAWAVSGAMVLTLFQSHWDLIGFDVPVDRYALILAIASVLAREWRHRDGRLETRPVDWFLIVFMLYAIVSAWMVGTLDERDARFELVDRLGVVPLLLFFVAPFAFRDEAGRRVLLGTLVGIGAYLGITSLLEAVGADDVAIPGYIGDESQGIHNDRSRGPFLDAGANGIAMYMCAVASAIAFVKWRDPRWRVAALAVAGLCLLGCLLTVTRIVWLSAVVASPLAMLAARQARRYLVPAALAVAAVVIVALAVIPGLAAKADTRRNDNSETFWARQNSNAAAVRMIEDKPLLGFGWGRFGAESHPYYRQSQDYPLTFLNDLHNVYLANAVELGLIGALLWLAALAWSVGGAILRRGPPELFPWKIGLIAVAVSLLVSWLTAPAEYVFPTLLMWLWAGVAWGAHEAQERQTIRE